MITVKKSFVVAGALLGCVAAANAGVVFQADFNGSGNGTGGAGDIVTSGGTGSLATGNANFAASIQGTTPVTGGNYLNTLWPSTGSGGGSGTYVTYTPTNAASSFASFVGTPVSSGGRSYLNMNGGYDVFTRLNVADTTVPRSAEWLGAITVMDNSGVVFTFNGLGWGAARLQINTTATNGFTDYTKLSGPNGSATGSVTNVAYMDGIGDFYNGVGSYHLGFTFSTDQTTGLITAKVFGRKDMEAIDTTATTDLQYSASFHLDTATVGTGPISSGVWHQSGWANIAGESADYDTVRLYAGTPASFDAVPEPASLSLLGLGGLTLLRRRRH